jgi:RimJ/RimL family protein N-acetyltransferase
MTGNLEPHWQVGEDLSDWKPAASIARSVHGGRWCSLEPVSVDDHADDLFKVFQTGPEANDWLYLPYGPFDNQVELEAWITAACLGDDPMFFTIRDKTTGRACGVASFLNIVPGMGSIEVGHIHFSPTIQQTHVATESMYLMMRLAFEAGYRRYEWKCNSLNERSRRAAMRFGFSYEGVFRQHLIAKQRNRDTAWYACIDSEWPELKVAYETWLRPENFSADGTQKQSLSSLTGPVLKARG